MPQDVSFPIPFHAPVSPHLEASRPRHLAWIRERGLVRSEAGLREYLSWDLPQAAARTYPHTAAEDMEMLLNWFSLGFLFDDQSDVNAPGHAGRVAAVCRDMITTLFRPPGAAPDLACPVTLAWAEVWAWLSDGMSQTWCDRFAASWARFLAAHAGERRLGAEGAVLPLEEYVLLRRRTIGVYHSIDAAERTRRTEVPAHAQAHPLMGALRDAAVDTIALMNDVHSLEREERRRDPHNLVTVLRAQRRCTRQEAVDEAVRLTGERLADYLRLEARVPRMCRELRLDRRERAAVQVGVEGMRNWIRGNHDWARTTGRYTAAPSAATAAAERDGRGSVDDLLEPSAPEAYAFDPA